MTRHGWLVLLLAPMLSCGHGEGVPVPTQAPLVHPEVAGPRLAVAGARQYRSNWAATPAGQAPGEFVDVRADGHRQSWLYDGGWRVATRNGEAVLEVPFSLQDPPEPLSFRRYVGTAFGPDGALPRRYRIEAEARSLGESKRFRGYGELAIQGLYLSPTTYIEVLQTDQHFYLWEADEAPPMQNDGWRQLGRVQHSAGVGQWVTFGIEVDRDAGTVVALLDGKPVARGTSSLLKRAEPAHFTIRATGNREEWRWITVTELP